MAPALEFFATCAPGIEPLLHAEARALKLSGVERQVGGVRFTGSIEDAWRANLRLRTAVRVLLRVARFEARDADALYAGTSAVDWERFLRPDGALVVDARSKESALDHTLFVEQRVKDAVADAFRAKHGSRPSVSKDAPDVAIHAHLFRDRCTLLADTSGESLHKRGWRRFQGRAPLAETLAAAMVLFAEWDGRSPLVDPFCGSGTILVEAALLAGGIAPGRFRERFAFEGWPGHDAARWRAMRDAARRDGAVPPKLVLRGTDTDPAAVAGALENVAAAGLAGRIAIEAGDAGEFAPKRGWNALVATNPPYGERVGGGERELAALYRGFGAALRQDGGGYRYSILSGGSPSLDAALGLDPEKTIALANGAIECRLLVGEVPR